jgi:tetratricopeptide (TPR) repeat protein
VTQVALATLLARMGRQQEALAFAETALQTHQQLGDPRQLARVQATFAELLRQSGNTDAAEKGLRVSLDLYTRLNDRRGVSTTQAALARVMAEQGDPVGAERLYRAAMSAAAEANDPRGVAVTSLNLAQWLHEQGRSPEALALGWQAYHPLRELGYEQDALHARNLLVEVRRGLPPEDFQQAWQAVSNEPPPAWLGGESIDPT